MSRYNPVELIWDAMLRAAALGASENDDPGLIDIMDFFWTCFAGYGSGDDVEREDGHGGQGGEGGREGGENGQAQGGQGGGQI